MKNTNNYNLPLFESGDKFNKETINETNSKIDLAISDLQETFNANATGSALTTQEVVEARKGKETLKDRIDGVEADVVSNKTQLDNNTNKINFLDKAKMKFVYNAKALGGDVDDRQAIINALANEDIVYLPKGRYIIDKYISIPSNKTLIGEKDTVIYYNQTNVDNCHILIAQFDNITIDGVTVEGNTTYGKNSFGILVNGVQPTTKINNINIKNCTVKNISSAGIVAREVKNITIDGCIVDTTNRDGIQLTGCENFLISHCKTVNTHDDGICSHSGYTDGYCYGNIVNNIVKNSNTARGITSAGGQDINISNNLIDGFGQSGIMILYDNNFADGKKTPSNIVVSNNTIINRTNDQEYLGGTCGIYLYQPTNTPTPLKNVVINGNNIYSRATTKIKYGVRFNDNISDVNISGNNIESKIAFQFGAKTFNTLITNNIVFTNILLNCWGDGTTENGIVLNNNKCSGYENGKLLSVNGLVRLIASGNEFKDFPTPIDKSNLKSNIYDNTFINTPQVGIRGFLYDTTTKVFTPFTV